LIVGSFNGLHLGPGRLDPGVVKEKSKLSSASCESRGGQKDGLKKPIAREKEELQGDGWGKGPENGGKEINKG